MLDCAEYGNVGFVFEVMLESEGVLAALLREQSSLYSWSRASKVGVLVLFMPIGREYER